MDTVYKMRGGIMGVDLWVSLIYLVSGVLWILFSDALVAVLFGSNTAVVNVVQTIKGWLFVLVTTLLLYLVLRRELAQRQRGEESVRKSEQQFRYLFMNNPHPMWIFDYQTLEFLDVNETAVNHYGYSRAEFLSMHITDIRPHDEIERTIKTVATTPPRDISFMGTWKHKRKDQRIIYVEIVAHGIDYNGRQSVLVVAQDVTERQLIESELRDQQVRQMELSQQLEIYHLREDFMYTMSHEFRNPLTTILSSAELLEMAYVRLDDEARKRHFERIKSQVDRLVDMVDNMLMTGETNGLTFKPTMLDIGALCKTLVEEAQANDRQRHRIAFHISCQQASMRGDEKLLRHAITNLLSNAVKYSPNNTEVMVDLHCTDDEVQLSIKDQGIGIPPEEIDMLFQPFQRATNVGAIPGTGLGLHIAKQATELHGGKLEVESKVGTGTTFNLHLPRQPVFDQAS